MPITKGFQALVDEAMAQVTTYSVAEVRVRLNDAKVQIVDIRDARELEHMGMTNVAHIDGGFTAWAEQGAPVESYEAHKARRHSQA